MNGFRSKVEFQEENKGSNLITGVYQKNIVKERFQYNNRNVTPLLHPQPKTFKSRSEEITRKRNRKDQGEDVLGNRVCFGIKKDQNTLFCEEKFWFQSYNPF